MNVQVFKNEQFGEIRTVVMNGEPWFVGKDVAGVLGYKDSSKALQVHVDADDKLTGRIASSGQARVMNIINEGGLYSLILSSKLPQAKAFKHWVTGEVLPQIRKTGGYIPVSAEDDEKSILVKAVSIMKRTVKALLPKAEYADKVLLSPTCYTMTEVAKGLSMTVGELTDWLLEHKVIYRCPGGMYMLYAKYLKQGLEQYRTCGVWDRQGNPVWTDTYLVWTEKGREYIHGLTPHRGVVTQIN